MASQRNHTKKQKRHDNIIIKDDISEKHVFIAMSEKMTTIIEKFDISEKITERLDGLANLFTSKIDGLTNIIRNHSENAGKLSEKMTKELTLTGTEMVEELKKISTVQEKQTFKSQRWRENNDLKRKIESWRNNFNHRKFTYWKSLQNLKLSEVYMRWTAENHQLYQRNFYQHQ